MLFIILYTAIFYYLLTIAYLEYSKASKKNWLSEFIYLFLFLGYALVVFLAMG